MSINHALPRPSACAPGMKLFGAARRWAMRTIRSVASIGLAALAAGCSIHPLPDDVSRKSTYDIVDKIRCEAKAAVEEHGGRFTRASIVYNFEFDIKEVNDASAGFTLLNPFKNGTFNLVATAEAKKETGRLSQFRTSRFVRRPAKDELQSRQRSELDISPYGRRGHV